MDNLIDKLRAEANLTTSLFSKSLIAHAADTIAAQARLLELAETLVRLIDKWAGSAGMFNAELDDMCAAADTLNDALRAHKATGKVPCPECAKWQTEARTLGETIDELLKASGSEHKRLMKAVYGFNEDATFSDTLTVIEKMRAEYQTTGKVPCPECERLTTAQDGLRKLVGHKNSLYAKLEAERDDLRRQLQHRTQELTDTRADLGMAEEREKDLRRQLAEAERFIDSLTESHAASDKACLEARADNAALVEVLEGVYHESSDTDEKVEFLLPREWMGFVKAALSQPHPGAGLLEELDALRKVAEAARDWGCACNPDDAEGCYCGGWKLSQAIKEVDAIRNRKDGR